MLYAPRGIYYAGKHHRKSITANYAETHHRKNSTEKQIAHRKADTVGEMFA